MATARWPRRTLLLCFVATTWMLGACLHDIHKHMTIEELQSTFHVDNHDLVPEYEVVHITDRNVRRRRSISNGLDNHWKDGNESNGKLQHDTSDKASVSKVPLYETPKTANIKLEAFGRPLNLKLVKTEGLFKKTGLKIWTVEPNATAQHGVEYVELPQHSQEDVGEVYQDEDNQAAILLGNDPILGHLLVEGSIGEDLVIKPLPSRLHQFLNNKEHKQESTPRHSPTLADDDEMFLDDDGELSAEVAIDTGLPIHRKTDNVDEIDISDKWANNERGLNRDEQSTHHIVFKRKENQDETESDYALMEPDHLAKRYRRSTLLQNATAVQARSKREAPYTIYPEILVIVDYDGYRLHGGDNLQIKRYFVSFWNGVDLRYKLLKGPKIRISIAGIIISRGRDATPYLERNRVGRDAIDSAAALTDMGKYLFRERRLPVYDIAVAITKLDMCRRSFPSDVCNRGTAGFAYVGGACVVNKRLEKVNSVAIIEDTGGFSGIIVAAHEVGHLLGAVHDGSPPPSYLGGPGAEKCQWTDGYIMSDLRHTERGFRWSSCSVASFHHFLNGDTATCLYNSPHEDDSLPRVLPGKLLTLDAQCRRDRGTSACFKDDRVCAQLFCFDAGSGYCVAYRPAAEGSPCGDGQYCLNGRCVAEHENIIPDYSQNTPAYIRRDGQANQGRPLFYDDEEDTNPEKPLHNTHNQQPEYTTKPPFRNYDYNSYRSTQNPYQFPTTPTSTTTTTTPAPHTTRDPYYYYSSTTATLNPHKYNTTTTTIAPRPFYYQTQTQQSTYNRPKTTFKLFSISTTRSPYDFQHFVNKYTSTKRPYTSVTTPPTKTYPSTSRRPYHVYTPSTATTTTTQTPSTKNPYIGNYYILRQKTTRNPYDFANFGKFYGTSSTPNYHDDYNNNYLKRSYNSASYYSDASSVRNVTRLRQ